MGSNRKISDLSDLNLNTQDLLDDRLPQTDAFVWVPAWLLAKDSANVALSRVAAGNWRLGRISAGAETYYVTVGDQTLARQSTVKGKRLLSVTWVYEIVTVAATTVTVTVDSTLYDSTPATVTTQTFTYDTAHDTAAERVTTGVHVLTATLTDPSYLTAVNTLLTSELLFTIPNTCELRVYGAGLTFEHDYL